MSESEFLRKLRERATTEIEPLRKYLGDTDPTVKMGLTILQLAEEVEQELSAERVATGDASERTGWSVDTLQRWARAKLDGNRMPKQWQRLDVEETTEGFFFRIASIPRKAA